MEDSGSINSRQNQDENLKHFCASRVWYRRGRGIATAQVVLAFSIPLCSAALLVWFPIPAFKVWINAAGITAAIFDALVLDRLQKQLKSNGANEQELFDTAVLDIPWPEGIAGDKPSISSTTHAISGANPSANRDWYPDVAKVPQIAGALICQHCSSWWDSKLRESYIHILVGVIATVALLLAALGISKGEKLENMVLTFYAPLLPALVWTCREIVRHHDTKTISERTAKLAANGWKQYIDGTLENPELFVRDIQDAIYYRRKTSPFVPKILGDLQRDKYLLEMATTTAEMVKTAGERGKRIL